MTTITYTWGVVQLECYPEVVNLTDVVFTVHWTLLATDASASVPVVLDPLAPFAALPAPAATGYAYGSIGVPAPTGAFTPYAALTVAEVIGWVQSAMGAEAVASYEAGVAAQIEAQINPTVVTPPLPWLSAAAAA